MSPVVKYDVSDVEPQATALKPDVYDAKIIEANYGNSSNGNKMFTIKFEVVGPNSAGFKLWHYIVPDSAEFRLREFTDALELPPKGSINTDKIVGTVLKVRTVVQKSEEYGEQARIKNVLPGVEATGDDEGEEPPYEEWEQAELAEEIEARELTITGRKTKAKMVKALTADDEAAEASEDEAEEDEDEDEEEEEGDGEELTRADLDEMDRASLKALIKDEEIEVKVLKKDTDDDLREKVAEALELGEAEDEEEEEAEDEDEEDEEESNTYEEWDMDDLKTELKERGLKPDGRKSILVARLKKDDESGDDPF